MSGDSRFAGMKEELLTSKIRGYRQWAVPANHPRLRSMNQVITWETSEFTAGCTQQDAQKHFMTLTGGAYANYPYVPVHEGPAPDPMCGCGIYGWFRPEDTNWQYGGGEWPVVLAFGAIEVWGHTLIGTRGFRTQHARILGLCMPGPDRARIPQTPVLHNFWSAVQHGMYVNGGYVHTYTTYGSASSELPSNYPELVARIRETYQVPIFHSLDDLCETFPPDDMSTLIPNLPSSMFSLRQIEERRRAVEIQRRMHFTKVGEVSPEYLRELLRGL